MDAATRRTSSIEDASSLISCNSTASSGTVRNWADSGKLRSRRLPQNGYRLFLKRDLEAVLGALHRSERPSRPSRRSTGKKRA